ncbi:aminotransferase class I/II-fold pyridoxal phosphate-dependent enzyme [Actinoplanes sp. NPDC020271]|uniref:aminotransferase class I/II-fold pyridoxal phosphate-dependent enzyme n=1 Tax=Actinoplanes sp. NPDC020271 TaxID=3363896 RepID=UPI0037BB035D
MNVVDFTSALYLDLRHPSRCLAPWQRLTTGVPAALAEAPGVAELSAGLARLLGRPAATPARSGLHAMLDVVGALGDGATVWCDAGAYPTAVQAARAAGRRPRTFTHHDPADLARRMTAGTGRPLVLCDGYCPGCGTVAPLDAYLRVAGRAGGLVVVDDTQAAGVLGHGAGSPAWLGVTGPGLVTVASLAKGFGVPMAVVAGDPHLVARVRERGPARMHGSAPSAVDLRAADHAVRRNGFDGDRRREHLLTSVRRLREGLGARGVRLTGGLFPLQSTPAQSVPAAAALTSALLERGVRAVAHRPQCRPAAAVVSLLITAAHRAGDIDRAVAALAAELPAVRNGHGGLLTGVRA